MDPFNYCYEKLCKARFKRRTLHVPNLMLLLSNDPGKNSTIFYCSAAIISFPHIETVVFSDQEFIN